jgi:hypothetical protein
MKKKARQTCLEKFGVPNAAQSSVLNQKRIKNMLVKYGVRHACELPHVKKSAHTPEALLKQHKTKCKNGTYKKSHLEIEFGSALQALTTCVKQVWLTPGGSIDFYLPDVNCYVQFDGIHWHGLDNRILGNTKHDRIIARKFQVDRELDASIQERRLIRITDIWYKTNRIDAANIVMTCAQNTSWKGVRFFGEHYEKLRLAC